MLHPLHLPALHHHEEAAGGTLTVPLNRVEGDLELRVSIADGAVTDAWSCGTLYRGFENLLVGRDPMDALVVTTRICGICTTAHLAAAVDALDRLSGARVPPAASLVRNVVLAVEHVQSDVRHGLLMFAADFVNPAYRGLDLYDEAVRRYAPLQGRSAVEALQETRRVLEIVAILAGQWPHSAFMVPGGIASSPTAGDFLACRQALARYRRWYEERVLGCPVQRFSDVKSAVDLDAWLEECDAHRQGDVGFLLRFGRAIGLDRLGRGCGNFVSGGVPQERDGEGVTLHHAGFRHGADPRPFDQARIEEHVAHSWFRDYPGGRHPFDGETAPYATGAEGRKYSWAKAPRYDGLPAETGPLAEELVAGHPLFTDLVRAGGPNALARQLARLARPCRLLPAIDRWLGELLRGHHPFYAKPAPIEEGQAFGLANAARGLLGHWVKVSGGRIRHYQIVTPTSWNASPRDSAGVRGPWEEALVGTPVRDPENPVEVGHVVRSFDACLVCSVHAVRAAGGARP